jgi:hypothetical protein
MRIYTIDQLDENDVALLNDRLKTLGLQAGLEGVYWLPVPDDMLAPIQREHLKTCGPYCLALEVTDSALHLELLVRGLGRISCACLSFASEQLRDRMIAYVEDTLRELEIPF